MRVLKRLFFTFLALMFILLAGGIAFAHFYGDEVKSYVLQSLNNAVNTEIDVKDVEFGILKSFPFASLEFKEVLAKEAWQKVEKDTLFYASSIFLKFNIWDIINQTYKVQALELVEASIFLKIDEAGTENFRFWKKDSRSDPKFSLQLESVTATDLHFSYNNKPKDQLVKIYFDQTGLNGNFSQSNFEAKIHSKLFVKQLQFKEESYFSNRSMLFDGSILVDSKNAEYIFKNASLHMDNMQVEINGNAKVQETTFINLKFASDELLLDDALTLLSTCQKNKLSAYAIEGAVKLSGQVRGELSENAFPHIDIEFTVSNGAFEHSEREISFRNISFNGKYNNGQKNERSTTSIQLQQFNADFGEGSIQGNLTLKNFTHPTFAFDGKLLLEMRDLSKFLEWEILQEVSGKVHIDLRTNGSLENLDSLSINDWKKANTDGSIILENISFKLKDRPQLFQHISGQLELNNNSIAAKDLRGNISKSDFLVNGEFNNLIAFLLYKDENLMVDASFISRNLELNELLLSNEKELDKEEEEYLFSISDRLRIRLKAEVDSLTFRRFSFVNCKADVIVKDRMMSIENVHFRSMEGEINGNLLIDGRRDDLLRISSGSELKNINVRQLFYDMNDFGQNAISYENLRGIATADIEFIANFSPKLQIDPASLEVQSNFLIEEGQLVNFKTLEPLSKYIELEELKNIRFSKLQNQIKIKNRKVFIPKFDIVSSAIDLSLEGTHTFDNQVDYKIVLILDQLLGSKVKKPRVTETEFGYIEDDGLGRSRLFLKMQGNLNNPIVKYDAVQLKEHWKNEVKKEKNDVKSILKEEFGIFKKNSDPDEEQSREEIPFKFEWGENEEEMEAIESEEKINSDKKSGFGKFIDKIAKPNPEEFEKPNTN